LLSLDKIGKSFTISVNGMKAFSDQAEGSPVFPGGGNDPACF
jgi:hypothetical protein